MKKIILLASLVGASLFANAQFKLGIQGGPGIPLGGLADMSKLGFGGGLAAKYHFNDNFALTASVSYYSLGKKKIEYDFGYGITGSYELSATVMPITVGAEYYFTSEGFKPFVGLDLGNYSVAAKVSGASASESSLGVAPKIGFLYGVSDNLDLGINAQYHYLLKKFADATTGEEKSGSLATINVALFYTFGK